MPDAPAALVGLDDVADLIGIQPEHARDYLEAHGEAPAASYHGMPLWLSDAVHDLVEDLSGKPPCAPA